MAKLSKDTAEKVDEVESGFSLVEPGIYEVKLNDVKVGEGPAGPYWTWELEIPDDDEEYAGRKFWTNTSLSEKALWKLKETFEAFGVSTDTDTDDLIGQRVRIILEHRTINSGSRQGELGHDVRALLPLDPDGGSTSDPAAGDSKSKAKSQKASSLF